MTIRLPAILAFALGSSSTLCLPLSWWIPAAQPLSGPCFFMSLAGTELTFLALCLEPRLVQRGPWITTYRVLYLSLALNFWPFVLLVGFCMYGWGPVE
jgi:hypothetical protein